MSAVNGPITLIDMHPRLHLQDQTIPHFHPIAVPAQRVLCFSSSCSSATFPVSFSSTSSSSSLPLVLSSPSLLSSKQSQCRHRCLLLHCLVCLCVQGRSISHHLRRDKAKICVRPCVCVLTQQEAGCHCDPAADKLTAAAAALHQT